MKRLVAKEHAYKAKDEFEKLVGYLVTRRSGLSLSKEHFDDIREHFHNNGGHMDGLKENASDHWGQIHDSIHHVLKKHKLK